jgi:hypothetical protein
MAMTKRERYLAIAVGGVVGILALQFMISSVRGRLDAKQKRLEDLNSKIETYNRKLTDCALAGARLNALKSKSLPKEDAPRVYSTWLREMAEAAGVQNITLDAPTTGASIRSDAFTAYRFALKGEVRLDDLIKLLHNYYDRDYLHRVQSLKINPLAKEPERVSITLVSEALALKVADLKQPPSLAHSGRVTKSFEQYRDEILRRNPFAPPNKPPQFSVSPNKDLPREREWSLELKATDPDPRHRITYQLLSDKPEGLSFSEETGKLTWTPKQNGQYELLVKAVDSGFPPKTTEQKLTLKVVDPPAVAPPAEAPKFDAASQSFVSAILSGRDGAQVWIRTKTDNNLYKVKAGDEISIGTIKGKVIEVNVDEQFVEIESEGRRWTLGMDDSLQAAFKKAQVD